MQNVIPYKVITTLCAGQYRVPAAQEATNLSPF